MLQHLTNDMLERLAFLIQCSIALAHTPTIWLGNTVLFLPKGGRRDWSDPKSYRPISLASFVHKATERMCLWRANDTCLCKNPLHHAQHAFRKGKSCDSALCEAVDMIEAVLNRQEIGLGLFLDISGAFDNVRHSAALAALKSKEFGNWFINWYKSYLTDRTAAGTIHGVTVVIITAMGSPQGGVFSPTLWNICFDELLEILNKLARKGIGYADDALAFLSCLLYTSPSPRD